MKAISLTQGKIALVDDKDYNYINQFKWFVNKIGKNYYAIRKSKLNGKQISILMHRELLSLEYGNKLQGDHITGNTLDNCMSNLRVCTNAQNAYNQKASKGSSCFKGVDWHKLTRRWRARIMVSGINKHLGLFINENDAALCYDYLAIKYFGDFARTNF